MNRADFPDHQPPPLADEPAGSPVEGSHPPRTSELRALQTAQKLPGDQILCTSLGRGQAAATLAAERPSASVVCWFLDQYQQRLAIGGGAPQVNLAIVCSADLPEQTFDLAVVPLSYRGEAELARDLIQDAFARLRIGGHLVTAVDNPRDQWVHEQLRDLFPKVTVIAAEDATSYVVVKRAEQRRRRSLVCEFTFRAGPRLLKAITRPGVFSHRRLDPGARQLIDAVPAWPPHPPAAQSPGAQPRLPRIIDIGCGSGVVGVALAARQIDPSRVHVLGLDSNARAIQCAARSAELNAIDSLVARLDSEGGVDEIASYDIAVANPPYYADFRIARLFVDTAARALRPGAMLYLVTKHPAWYQENLFPGWRDATISPSGKYFIVTARRG